MNNLDETVMTATNDATNKAAVAAVFGALEKNWGWLLAFGIISILLWGVGLYMTFGLTLGSSIWPKTARSHSCRKGV